MSASPIIEDGDSSISNGGTPLAISASDSDEQQSEPTPTLSSPPNDPSEVLNNKTHKDIVSEMRKEIIKTAPNRQVSDYHFLKVLGEGSFSTVYLAHEIQTNKNFAVKVMNKESIRREKKFTNVLRERDVMASLTYAFGGHPFIVDLHCAFQDRTRLFFVIKAAPNGELYDLLKYMGKFDKDLALFYCTEIVEALSFIHKCRVIHRDLKPENILIGEDWHILISDFGSAKIVGDKEQEALETEEASQLRAQGQSRGSFVGTAQYISPEVLQSQCAGYEADYWAVGAILFQMLTGYAPFRASNEYHIMRRVMNLEYDFPEGFPQTAKDLIQKFLVIDPSKRLGSLDMGGVDLVKNHPYFEGIVWDEVKSRLAPSLLPKLPTSWEKDHRFPEVTSNVKPGLNEDALTRLMGFGADAPSSPPLPPPPVNVLSPDQIKELKLTKQKSENAYHKFVNENLIIKHGFVDKKKGLFARRRMFLLTEGPHLYYVDPVNMELRGEVPFTKELRTEAKNFRSFFVHTPNRSYILFDPERNAKAWCDAIDEVRDRYFKNNDKKKESGESSSKQK
uniref:3-phosphoinositide-dependent protein kinase 1 n=1 Tax=Panagrolaimus sp. ES5 TaxID=591445 RepID=A0AC34FID8_9BILA